MANKLITPEVVAKEALMQLQNNLVMVDLVHKDYSTEFVKVGDTVNVRKPATFKAKNFLGTTERQDIVEGSVPVKLDRLRDITVSVSSKEWTLDLADFSEQIVQPAMSSMAQAVDEDLICYGVEKAGSTVKATPNPTDLKDIAQLAKKLDINKALVNDRRLVLHPEHKYNYALTDNLSKVSYAGDNETLRNALLGRVYTLDTYMDQNCPNTGAAVAGTVTSYKVTGTKNTNTVALSNVVPSTGTIKKGDGFIHDGYLYRFTDDYTAISGAVARAEVDIKLVSDFNALSKIKLVNKPSSLAFQKNGLALVTRQLELPQGAAKAAIASANGLAVRVVFGYDQDTKEDIISFDILYGIKDLDSDLLVALE